MVKRVYLSDYKLMVAQKLLLNDRSIRYGVHAW